MLNSLLVIIQNKALIPSKLHEITQLRIRATVTRAVHLQEKNPSKHHDKKLKFYEKKVDMYL